MNILSHFLFFLRNEGRAKIKKKAAPQTAYSKHARWQIDFLLVCSNATDWVCLWFRILFLPHWQGRVFPTMTKKPSWFWGLQTIDNQPESKKGLFFVGTIALGNDGPGRGQERTREKTA